MTKLRSYFTASMKSKIAIAAVEGKLTQAQITSEYGVHATQIKAWKQPALKAIEDVFSGAYEKHRNSLLRIYIKKSAAFKHNYRG